jgi:hypothetical protein
VTPLTIEHITLTTGAVRISPRSEVDDEAIARIVVAMRSGGRLWGGWSVAVTPLAPGAWRYTLRQAGAPVVTCWLCADAGASDATWEAASDPAHLADERVILHRPRGVPWLAVALLPAALTVAPQHLHEAGDAERCVAWAILARK